MNEQKVQRVCAKHGAYTASVSNIMGRMFESMCPLCEKEQVALESENEQTEDQQRIINIYKKENIEKEFYGATFENYHAETKDEKNALMAVRKIVADKKGKVLLLGKNGCGKTHLLSVAVKALGGYIYTMYEISTMIRQSYTSLAKESELDIVNRLAWAPMLAIDEVGRTKGSEAEQNWLSYILDKRHVRGLPTGLASNKLPKKMCGPNETPFEFYMGTDILSRFQQDTESIMMLDCRDHRKC